MNDKESRIERCRKAVEQSPASASAQFNLGLAYTQLGRVGQAEEAYRKALEIDPEDVDAVEDQLVGHAAPRRARESPSPRARRQTRPRPWWRRCRW